MDFRILGPIEVVDGGEPLRLGGPAQRALLAYLVLHEGEVVPAHRLLDELWHSPPAGGVAALHSQVSRLRRVIGERIATVDTGYAFRRQEGDELDLAQFRSLLAEAGATADPHERARLLRAADALWRGTPFDGLDLPFVAGDVLALEELRVAAIEERIDAELEAGRNGDLVSELATLVSRYPLREGLRRQWILALYRSGRQADALEAHRETRRMFDEELGLELSPALAELERAILQHDPSLARPRAEAPAALPAPRRSRPWIAVALVLGGVAAIAGGGATAVVLTRGSNPAPTVAAQEPRTVVETRRVRVPAKPTVRRVTHKQTKKPPAVVLVSSQTTTIVQQAPPPPVTTTVMQVTRTPVVSRPATTTTRHAAKPKPAPTVNTISDAFNGSAVNARTWFGIGEGTGWNMAERDGHLEFSFTPGTATDPHTGNYGGHLGTQCTFPGDFDARIDYRLAQWPAANGVSVRLYTGSWIAQPGDSPSGTLRVSRHKGVIATYYARDGSWVQLASGPGSGGVSIGVGAVGSQPLSDPVAVEFDNFRVTAINPVC